jgi:hypothetical protein
MGDTLLAPKQLLRYCVMECPPIPNLNFFRGSVERSGYPNPPYPYRSPLLHTSVTYHQEMLAGSDLVFRVSKRHSMADQSLAPAKTIQEVLEQLNLHVRATNPIMPSARRNCRETQSTL